MAIEVKHKTAKKWLTPFGRKHAKDYQKTPATICVDADDSSLEENQQRVETTKPCTFSSPESQVDYGYGDAAPDSATQVDYGYGDAIPDSAQVDYEYGDAAPSPRTQMPRRSSMKGSSPSRRASIGPCGEPMTLRLPGNQEPVQRRRSITFNKKVAVKNVETSRSLAPHPQCLWFQDEEYEMIKKKTLAVIHRASMTSESAECSKKLCTRGLEKWMCPERTEVKKRQAWDNVLNEQYLQQQDGEYDEEQLATMYKLSTTRSQVEAAKRAQSDAQEIESYLASTRKYHRRMSM
jgi:hypothetical protein